MKHGNQKIPHVYTMEPQSENDGIFQPRKNRKVSIWKQVDSQVRWARTTEILMLFFSWDHRTSSNHQLFMSIEDHHSVEIDLKVIKIWNDQPVVGFNEES